MIAFWPWSVNGPAIEETLRSAVEGAPAGTAIERGRGGAGLAAWLEDLAAGHPDAELALVADAGTFPAGWLEQLLAAAHSDDALAAATLPVLGGSPAARERDSGGVHRRDPADELPNAAAAFAPPGPAPPRLLTPDPHAAVLRRDALALLGGLDHTFAHPFAVLADFAARVRQYALSCVLVPDVAVERTDGGLSPCPADELAALGRRHPWLEAAREDEQALDHGPLQRRVLAAEATRAGISVTVDARTLGTGVGGTQTYVGALIMALAARPELSVRAVLTGPIDDELGGVFEAAGVSTISYEEAASGESPRTMIVHRPQQVFTPSDLLLLELLGERVVVSHLDLIGYRAPTYHASTDEWRAYRRTTRLALACADQVIFFSDHARRDALAEDLVPRSRTAVAGIGIAPAPLDLPRSRPPRVPADRKLLLVLGTDYAHKNRPFALQLADELRRRHRWDGLLVLAGAHVPHGSTATAERELLAGNPDLAEHVLDLGQVSDAEKWWLFEAADAHICPSIYEGFGLAPLEAAAARRPCVYAARTSLREIIDPAAATIFPWDVASSADAAAELLRVDAARDRHLDLLTAALREHTWERVADRVLSAYHAALAAPFRAAAPRARAELQREQRLIEEHDALKDLRARVRCGLPLIDLRQPLLSPDEQRGLMRIAARRWLRGPLLSPLGPLGALRTGRARGPSPS